MNKKELFEAVIELPVDYSGSRPKIDKLTTLELIKLLDEPQKVVVPQFVADWIEKCKAKEKNERIVKYIYGVLVITKVNKRSACHCAVNFKNVFKNHRTFYVGRGGRLASKHFT